MYRIAIWLPSENRFNSHLIIHWRAQTPSNRLRHGPRAACPYRKLRPRYPATLKSWWESFYTGVVLATTLDLRELEFLLRQNDEYIQAMEFMIRKTPALDHGELALARKLRTKLSPGKQTEHRRKNIANKPG